MATNEILPFCPTNTGTNLLTEVEYAAATDRDIGNQPGIASSKLNNKVLRQAAFIVSQIAQYIADKTGQDVLDDGNTTTLLTNIKKTYEFSRIEVLSTTGTIAITTDIAEVSGTSDYTVTLPTASSSIAGKVITVKKTGVSGTVTLSPGIDATTITLDEQFQFVTAYCNGSAWSQKG